MVRVAIAVPPPMPVAVRLAEVAAPAEVVTVPETEVCPAVGFAGLIDVIVIRPVLLLEREMLYPAGAGPSSVMVKDEPVPPVTVLGVKEIPVTFGGTTV